MRNWHHSQLLLVCPLLSRAARQSRKCSYQTPHFNGERMNRTKLISIASIIAPIWFASIYGLVSMQRPDFRHFNQAVSELGSWDAPNLWVWNVLGYFLTGMIIFFLGLAVKQVFGPRGMASTPFFTLALSGLFMAIAGVFPGDFENRSSLTMILHTIGSFGSGLFFMISAFWLPSTFKKVPSWKWLFPPLLLIAIGMVLNTFLVTSGPTPGLGQRIGFACYLVWVALVGFALFKHPHPTNNAAQPIQESTP